MIFKSKNKYYSGVSALEVVRSLERDDKAFAKAGGPIRQYLHWSLNQLRDSVPPRELDVSDRLEEEALALGYLLLLDEYGIGEMVSEGSP